MWKAPYGGLEASNVRRLKIGADNGRLKWMYADLALENAALKDVIEKLYGLLNGGRS